MGAPCPGRMGVSVWARGCKENSVKSNKTVKSQNRGDAAVRGAGEGGGGGVGVVDGGVAAPVTRAPRLLLLLLLAPALHRPF